MPVRAFAAKRINERSIRVPENNGPRDGSHDDGRAYKSLVAADKWGVL
jgi:hypothetical protein